MVPTLSGWMLPLNAHAALPDLTTDMATYLSPTGATLNGSINNTGGETPAMRGFVYGVTTSYGNTTIDHGSTQVGAGKRNWNGVAMSSNGNKLVAASGSGNLPDYLYASSDGGATWFALTTAGKRIWAAVSMSFDGTKLAAVNNQYVFTSTDSGATWTQRVVPGATHGFRTVAISSDGSMLAAADNYRDVTIFGNIYTSPDGGLTWTLQTGAGSGYWSQLRFSPDGSKLIASAGAYSANANHEDFNHLWTGTTTDGGATWAWTRQDGAGQRNWISATFFSADGTKIAAADRNTGVIYTSTDSGSNWHADSSLGMCDWTAVAAATDGSRLALASNSGCLYSGTSPDGGDTWTWTSLKSGTFSMPRWNSAALSADGGKLIVGAVSTDFHISPTPRQPISATPFKLDISGLTCNTEYHVAAYATNASGTAYGSDTTFSTSPCPVSLMSLASPPATTDLGQEMNNAIDHRIDGFDSPQGGFRSLWTTRGNGVEGWQYNVTTLWSNQGAHALDFSGASPWNSTMQYAGAGTLISPRHLLFASHYTPAAGTTIGFLDQDNHVITRTLMNTRQIGTTDIRIGVLDADVPSTIAYYPLLSYADFQRHIAQSRVPMIRLDQNDTVFIQDITLVNSTDIIMMSSVGTRAPYTSGWAISGDSGNPDFVVIGDQLVLLGAQHTPNGNPDTGNYIAEINAAMTALGGGYQITQLDLSQFAQYVPPSFSSQSMSVPEKSAAGTVVGTVQVDGVNGMSTLRYSKIGDGDPLGVFSIDSNTGVITVAKPNLLDFSLVRAYSLTVSVSDSNPMQTTVTGTVTISVTYDPYIPHPSVSVPGGYFWTERPASGYWYVTSSSANGAELAAIQYLGLIWTSADYGATWTQQSVPGSKGWLSITLSADGTHLAAADYDSQTVWTAVSSDGGVTWNWAQRLDVGAHPWASMASSSDGMRLVAAAFDDGAIHTSSDAGATWVDRTPQGGHSWYQVTSSADGTKLAAVDYSGADGMGGYVYTSVDAGATWVERTGAGLGTWTAIASSADGSKLFAGDSNTGNLAISTDSGNTWIMRNDAIPSSHHEWTSISVSADGTRLIAADASGGYLHLSNDSGQTWSVDLVAGLRGWVPTAISADGMRVLAGVNGSSLWTGALTPSVTTGDPSLLASTQATLNGLVDAVGLYEVTTRGFQFGATTSYGMTSAEAGTFATGPFAATVSGLTCGTTYFVRAYATSSAGSTYGATKVFSLLCPFVLSYGAGAHGSISGISPQSVQMGQSGTWVTALPDAGYHFVSWSDGSTANPRLDANVQANLTVTASFATDNPSGPPGGDGSDNADIPLPTWATGLLMALLMISVMWPSMNRARGIAAKPKGR